MSNCFIVHNDYLRLNIVKIGLMLPIVILIDILIEYYGQAVEDSMQCYLFLLLFWRLLNGLMAHWVR